MNITQDMFDIFSLIFLAVICIVVAEDKPPIFLDQAVAPGGCIDSDTRCSNWASVGECQANAAWMVLNCKKSCQSCQGGDNALLLRNDIATRYGNKTDKTKKYAVNRVKLNSMDVKHFEIDETTQMVSMHGKLVLTWNDTQISWEKKAYNMSWITFYSVPIWAPSLVQSNAPASNPSKVHASLLAANYTGQVYMWADFTFNNLCDFDYTYYPFDRQRCCFQIDDERYYIVRLLLSERVKNDAATSARNTHPTGWKVNNVDIYQRSYKTQIYEEWSKDPFNFETSNLEICVEFKRDSSYINAEIIGPALAPAMVTLVSFLVGDFRRQIHMLVASLGLQIIALIPLHIRMPPPSGETPALLKFCSFNMAMTCLILLLTTFLLAMALYQTSLPPPRFVAKFVWLLDRCSCCFNSDSGKIEEDTNTIACSSSSNNSSSYLWAPVARAIKCLIFLVCLCSYIFAILGCFA